MLGEILDCGGICNMISSQKRGHTIVYENNNWLYADDKSPITAERPCKRCGKMPTEEGYDACLGYIPGAQHACCGHGIHEKMIQY
jgi:hypothetical protein